MSSSNGRARDLTLDDFRKKRPRTLRSVYLPGLGGTAYLQSLYGDELERWEDSRISQRGSSVKVNAENTRASLLVLALVSADGRPLGFTEEDIQAIGQQSALDLNLLYDAACEMNGLRPSDLEALNRPPLPTTPAVSSGSA
jgi:hypothetical protein